MPLACAAASADAACCAMRRMRCSGSFGLARQALRERLALEELHHDERAAVVGVAEVGDVDDVLVADRRRELRLLLEARDDRFALRVLLEQDLDRDALADQRVRRLVDRAHAALADLARDEVATRERRADELGLLVRERRSSVARRRPMPRSRRSRARCESFAAIATAVSPAPIAVSLRAVERADDEPFRGIGRRPPRRRPTRRACSPEPVDIRPLTSMVGVRPGQVKRCPLLSRCRNVHGFAHTSVPEVLILPSFE